MDILYIKYSGIYLGSQMWVQLTIYSLVMEWDGMCLGHEMTWCRSPVAGVMADHYCRLQMRVIPMPGSFSANLDDLIAKLDALIDISILNTFFS